MCLILSFLVVFTTEITLYREVTATIMPLRLSPTTRCKPVNVCIYCGATGPDTNLTDEHVVPLSLGGTFVLPKASCLKCAKPIATLEGYAARHVFQDVRIEHGFPTRRPKERPTHLPLRESFSPSPELAPIRLVPTTEYPGMLILTIHEPAGILMGRPPEAGSKGQLSLHEIGGRERVDRLTKRGIKSLLYREFKPDLLMRLVVKMAFGFAVAKYGLDFFDPTVQDVILRRDSSPYHWAGGVTKAMDEFPRPSGKVVLHRFVGYTRQIAGELYLVVQLQLFAYIGATPGYAVVVGKVRK